MKKIKVLIADDEEMLCDLYEMIIESEYSCEVIKVFNGAGAIEALKSGSHFDVILSDYNMPQVNGAQLYMFNKAHDNIPFFLFSGGDLQDYKDLTDFYQSNPLNKFLGKPFAEQDLLDAIAKIFTPTTINHARSSDQSGQSENFVKVKLDYYAQHAEKAAEVYIKLGDGKYTKIINSNGENIPDKNLLEYYLKKGIDYVYIDKFFLKIFINDIFNKFHQKIVGGKKAETIYQLSGFNFHINMEGLNDIGISNLQIEKINEVIEETISSLLNNSNSKDQFLKLCEGQGQIIGHSMLIMYIAGRIVKETNLNFGQTMKKICIAAFYHDFGLFEQDAHYDEIKLSEVEHPITALNFLPDNIEIAEDIKKIIMQHHEMPNGDGHPKKLTANQISPLSCLFILSEKITYCLIRNNFSREHLKNFLKNSENIFNQGNFSQFFKAVETIF